MPRLNKLAFAASVVTATALLGAGISGCSRGGSAQQLVADALQYQQKGDNKAALIQLKNAVSKSPEDAEVRLLLASLYNQTGDAVSAEKEARKAISLGMDPDRALPQLAQALIGQGQAKKAVEETEAAAAKGKAPLLNVRGDALMQLGEPARAKEAFDAALKAQPDSVEAMIGQARYALSQKDSATAIAIGQKITSAYPKNAEGWMFQAGLLRAQNKIDEALATYDKVVALQPNHRSAYIEKAYLEIGVRKFDAARADLDAARKHNASPLIVLYTQALLDFNDGKLAAAKESLLKILKVAPDHPPSVLLAGAVELSLNSLEQAEQYLRKYLAVAPDNRYARKLLASTLLRAGRPADSLVTLQPLLASAIEDPELLALAGEAAMRGGDYKSSTAYFEKAAALAPKAASIHTALGLSKLAQGEGGAAVTELELATSLDAKSPKAAIALVMTEMRLKHYDKALAAVNALEKEQPNDPMVQDLKGGVYLNSGDVVKARASFEKALTLQPTYGPSVVNLAKLDLRDKKPDEAKKRFVALAEKDKKNIGALNALAELAMSQGKNDEATTWLERANSENPDKVEPAIRLASHYLRIGQKQKALTLARKFQTANSTNPDLLDLLGQTQVANGDNGGALETYSKLVNVVPKSAMIQFRLASVQMLMKNEAGAAESLKKALVLQPDYLLAQTASAELAARSGKPEQALTIARQMQKQAGREAVGYQLEGDIQLLQRKPEPALQAFEKAYSLNQSGALMIKIHSILARTGKEKLADARLAQWQKEHPADQLAGMYLGEVYLGKKQYKLAIEQLQAVIKVNPNSVQALNNLAWAYKQEKEPRALQTAEQAYQLAGDNPAVMDTLGWVLVEQGNTSRGLPLLQKAVALAPNASDIRYHLAAGLHKSGDSVNARKELDQVLAKGGTFPQIEEARVLRKQLQ